ncbi:ABC transporter substrate-binding protein [Rothia kristinae]|uniref:ABC transporter substrate-binding protein n=1 Tax=Rothia kristinae TaxID=37923 RepID=UPI001CD507DE|nr:ABC transporter substrate-binding protein [Rothia kristinae]MCA1169527.1 ABC transporter substrate-binding protein [Rothia kristinae]
MSTSRRGFLGGCLAAGLALSGCSGEEPSPAASASADPTRLTFADAAPAPSLDPSTDGRLETARISAQVLEPLVRANPDTGEAMAHLAESWKISGDGLTYTFRLRSSPRFHDGRTFDAQAVRANVLRWAEAARTQHHPPTAFQTVFRMPGTAEAPALFAECTAPDARTVVLRLNRRHPALIRALTQPAFGIASPASFADGKDPGGHPVGTGPFVFQQREDQTVRLRRNEDYWGDAPQVQELVFPTVIGAQTRYYRLLTGEADAIDLVGTSDFVSLARRGYQIQQRDPYNLAFLAINQRHPVFASVQLRRAAAHAINRSDIVRSYYPEGTETANDFTPKLFDVSGSGTGSAYRYDLGLAQRLVQASDYDGRSLRFCYPTDVSLPYLQKPEAIYARIAEGLTKAGFTIEPVPIPWSEDYPARIHAEDPDRALALTGIMGTYRDPDAFLAPLFSRRIDLLGAQESELFEAVEDAAGQQDGDTRKDAYRRINEMVSETVPAVPLAYPISAVALSSRVTGYPLAATGVAEFDRVTLSD